MLYKNTKNSRPYPYINILNFISLYGSFFLESGRAMAMAYYGYGIWDCFASKFACGELAGLLWLGRCCIIHAQLYYMQSTHNKEMYLSGTCK